MGRPAVIKQPTGEQIRFYNMILDENVLRRAISTIESIIKRVDTYGALMDALKHEFGYDNVEDLDHYHNNTFFDPNYRPTDKDSRDFLMIGVWADLKKIVEGLDDILCAVRVSIVWNDVQQRGWIIEVSIFFSKSRAYYMKPLCTIDSKDMEIINWKWKGKLPVPKLPQAQNGYTEISHINSLDDLKEFISFLIHEERIPRKIHAFDRFEDLIHPKAGFALFNESKAKLYTRLLDEGYIVYVKQRRKTSFDSYIMGLQRKVKQARKK